MSDFMRRLLNRDVALTADIWVEAAEAVQGTLVLSVQPSARRVGAHNAMDSARAMYFARELAAWAYTSLGWSGQEGRTTLGLHSDYTTGVRCIRFWTDL